MRLAGLLALLLPLATPLACGGTRHALPDLQADHSPEPPLPVLGQADEVVLGASPLFLDCLQRAHDEGAAPKADARIDIVVDDRGHVAQIEPPTTPRLEPRVERCLSDVVARLRFPPPPAPPVRATIVVDFFRRETRWARGAVHIEGVSPVDPANPPPRCLPSKPETARPQTSVSTPAPPRASVAPSAAAMPSSSARTSDAPNVPGADAVIAKNKWRFRVCYTQSLFVDPDARGTAKITATLDADGNVVDASASERGICPVWLGTCIANTFYAMRFSRPDGGTATFTVKVVFATKR